MATPQAGRTLQKTLSCSKTPIIGLFLTLAEHSALEKRLNLCFDNGLSRPKVTKIAKCFASPPMITASHFYHGRHIALIILQFRHQVGDRRLQARRRTMSGPRFATLLRLAKAVPRVTRTAEGV